MYKRRSKSSAFRYSPDGSSAQWWIPRPEDIDAAIARFKPLFGAGVTVPPGDKSNTVNAILNMQPLPAAPASPFSWTASTGVVPLTQPTRGLITRLDGFTAPPSFAALATFLQTVFRNVFDAGASVTTANRGFVFNTGSDIWSWSLYTSDAADEKRGGERGGGGGRKKKKKKKEKRKRKRRRTI